MERTYKELIFSNHARNRMFERTITPHAVWQVVHNPDHSRPESKPNTTRFIRTLNDRKYHVVATYLPDQKKTLIVSAWVRGEEDKAPVIWQLLVLPFQLFWQVVRWLMGKQKRRKSHSRK